MCCVPPGNDCDMEESCEDLDYDGGSEWGRQIPPLPLINTYPQTPDHEDKVTVQQIIAKK